MLTCTEVAAAAPPWVAGLLDGPVRSAEIVHAGADAIYVDAGGACVGLLGRSAVAVPCGLRTTLAALPDPGPAAASIGGGRLCVASLDVRVGRTVDATVARVRPTRAAVDALERATGDRLEQVRAELPPAALAALGGADPAAVSALLGRGSGLTPVGDDVLCGWAATRIALGAPVDPVAATIDARCDEATTMLSATLLRRAVAGDVIPAFRALLLSLRTDPPGPATGSAVDALLTTGHTSGAGMLLGCTLAVEADDAHAQRRGS